MQTLRYFASEQEARDYRHDNGTGGWIFVADDQTKHPAILFPPDVPPVGIFNHTATKGRSGRLIGSQ